MKEINSTLRSFWELEAIGIAPEKDNKTNEDTIEMFEKSVQFRTGRYEVCLPWKTEKNELSSDF